MAVPALQLNLAPRPSLWRQHHRILGWAALGLGVVFLLGVPGPHLAGLPPGRPGRTRCREPDGGDPAGRPHGSADPDLAPGHGRHPRAGPVEAGRTHPPGAEPALVPRHRGTRAMHGARHAAEGAPADPRQRPAGRDEAQGRSPEPRGGSRLRGRPPHGPGLRRSDPGARSRAPGRWLGLRTEPARRRRATALRAAGREDRPRAGRGPGSQARSRRPPARPGADRPGPWPRGPAPGPAARRHRPLPWPPVARKESRPVPPPPPARRRKCAHPEARAIRGGPPDEQPPPRKPSPPGAGRPGPGPGPRRGLLPAPGRLPAAGPAS